MMKHSSRYSKTPYVQRPFVALALVVALSSCSDDEPVNIDDSGGDIFGSVTSEGFNRTFVLHIPPSNDAAKPAPLLIVFHGTNMTGVGMQDLTVFETFTDQHDFLIIYLDGIDGGWSIGCDCTTPDELGISDVTTIERLLSGVSNSFAIDMDRVYLAGFSQGGMFAQIAGCELSSRIAGVASVGATTLTRVADGCALQAPLPILFIHGTDDTVVPYDGGPGLLSAPETLARWSELNGCQGDPEEATEPDLDPNDLTRVRSETLMSCDGGAEVSLYTVEGGGHTWPRGQRPLGSDFGAVSQDVSGSEVITEFFLRHQP
ncbi:MAG: alpha/beta hydrolase family esterase [Gemmatimonadales bacterium]